jgi:hypothetical protein
MVSEKVGLSAADAAVVTVSMNARSTSGRIESRFPSCE